MITFVPSDLMEDEIDKPSNPEEPVKPRFNVKVDGDKVVEKLDDKISDKPIPRDKIDEPTKSKKSKEEVEEEEKNNQY